MFVRIFEPTVEHVDLLVEVENLAWSSPGENITASREKLKLRVESGQTVVLATVEGRAAGSQYAFQFNWDEDIENLCSWDEYTQEGWTNKVHNPKGKTGFLVGIGVVPEFRRIKIDHNLTQYWPKKYKISDLLAAKTLKNLFQKGVSKVIANARIPFYHKKSHLNVDDYCHLRREDGKPFDPVLRFHERMGGKIIKPVSFSMEDEESLNGGCWVMYTQPFKGV